MNPEKECSTCREFKHGGGETDQGKCLIGKRDGITYGRYICPEWGPVIVEDVKKPKAKKLDYGESP